MSSPEPGVLSNAAPRGAAVTRERILDAAESLFAVHGLAGTSVRDIATEVGVTPASLYNHFPSKEALYQSVLARGVRPLMERLTELAAADDRQAAAEQIIRGLMAHLGEHPQLPRLIVHEAACGGENLVDLARDWIRPLVDRARVTLEREASAGPSPWKPDEFPLVITAWLNLVFGYFAMAPLLAEVLDRDPLCAESLADQTKFMLKLAQQMSLPVAAAASDSFSHT